MYSTLYNQMVHIGRFGVAFMLVFVLIAGLLFGRGREDDVFDGFVSRYINMVMLTLSVIYILVFIKLYELLSFLFVLGVIYVYMEFYLFREKQESWVRRVYWLYNYLESDKNFNGFLAYGLNRVSCFIRESANKPGFLFNVVQNLSIVFVFAYSAYLRFYDAVMHAAPAMSDAYVTLAWTKYIEQKMLFHDGIYPHGFHIYLSVLHKFAGTDPLYILKYAGPFNSVLIIVGLYFVVSRFTGSKLAGIVSAFVFGFLPGSLHLEFARQASTNSQEFAMVFLAPGLYYSHRYLENENRKDFLTAFSAGAVLGLVHSIVFAFFGAGLVCIAVAHLAVNFRTVFKRVIRLAQASFLSGIIAVLPAVIGVAAGYKFHSSSVEFLAAQAKVGFPPLWQTDKLAVSGFILFFVICLVSSKLEKLRIGSFGFLITGATALIMYVVVGPLTGKEFLITRLGNFWSILAPVGLGVGWFALSRPLSRSGRESGVEFTACYVLLIFIFYSFPPLPVTPYKIQRDNMVEQYISINQTLRPTEWMIVSSEDSYALVLGRGYHLGLRDFLAWYNPTDRYLARSVNGQIDKLLTPDIFIFVEKKMYRTSETSIKLIVDPIYRRRSMEYKRMEDWIKDYGSSHTNLTTFYEDDTLQVYRIHQEKPREKIFRDIWGSQEPHNL